MSITKTASNTTAPTQFLRAGTKRTRIAVSAADPDVRWCVSSISPEDSLRADFVEPGGRRSVYREACTTNRGSRHRIRTGRRRRTDGGVPGVGAIYGNPLRRSQEHPSARARSEWHPRRNDSRLELLSVGREPSERRTSRVPGLRTRFPLPVSRVLHPARGGIPGVGRAVRTLLSRREVNRECRSKPRCCSRA
jgi:hypothetical protein